MDNEKYRKPDRNERTIMLAETLKCLGYKIKSLKYLVDDNKQDEEKASFCGMPFLELTLSL